MDKIHILYFLEDRAQEGFIKAFVRRIAEEESIHDNSIDHDIRSAFYRKFEKIFQGNTQRENIV